MRLKKASLAFAGAAAAVAVTTMAASPAWACDDSDPALRLNYQCGPDGRPTWMVTNPNTFGAVPFTWMDNKGGRSDLMINAPAKGSVVLPTHANKVLVTAYRPDKRDKPVWLRHGAAGVAKCSTPSPKPTASHKPKPTAKPTETTTKPSTPSGEARPAKPVKAQPEFTG